jgi:hypothetical protein
VRTPKLIVFALMLALAASLMAFAACGGDDDNKSSSTNTPAGTSQATGGSTRTSGASATATEASGDSGSESDVLNELSGLGADIEHVSGKVTYKSTDESGDVSNITYYSSSNKSRWDSVDSDGSTGIFITRPDASYSCDSSSQTCIQFAGSGDSGDLGFGLGALFSSQYIDALVAAAEAQGIDVSKSDESINGIDATCFSGSSSTESGKFCFNDSGLLVYEESTSSTGTTKLEATNVGDVSDSDFEPPYPVSTIIPNS